MVTAFQLDLCVLKEDGEHGKNGWRQLVASELATIHPELMCYTSKPG